MRANAKYNAKTNTHTQINWAIRNTHTRSHIGKYTQPMRTHSHTRTRTHSKSTRMLYLTFYLFIFKRKPPTLPNIPSSSSLGPFKDPTRHSPTRSKKEKKEEKQKFRELKTARHTNVTHSPGILSFLFSWTSLHVFLNGGKRERESAHVNRCKSVGKGRGRVRVKEEKQKWEN